MDYYKESTQHDIIMQFVCYRHDILFSLKQTYSES